MPESSGSTRLYLDDPERTHFRSRVLERLSLPEGGIGLVLAETCFYPTSGGQPHDTGILHGSPVVDVVEDEAGRVVHCLGAEAAALALRAGDSVEGEIDGSRRRHHMQQHSGQHLLSATFVALLQRETVSFHLGESRCSIDLPGPLLEAEALEQVEKRANAVIWEGRPLHVRSLDAAQVAGLRKAPPAGLERVRVVEIEGWDSSPCCGTHVRRTHEIGLIKLLVQERLREAARLHFVCGTRALEEVARCFQLQDALVRALTCHPEDVLARVGKLQEEGRQLRRQLESTARELATGRAEARIAAAPRLGGHPLVLQALEGVEAAALQAAAAALVERGAIALLGAAGERAQFLFVCPSGTGIDLRPALQAACALAAGRGGGTAERVQGSGARVDALLPALEAARAAIEAQVTGADFDKPANGP